MYRCTVVGDLVFNISNPQVVISLEWVGLKQTCSYETSDHILSLAYIFFLIILVSALSIKYKHIKDNYKEAYSIFFLMVLTVPTWIAWVSSSLLLPAVYSRAAFGQFLISIFNI